MKDKRTVQHSATGNRPSKLGDLLPLETASVEETMQLGEQIAAHLRPGDIVALYGDLGAGKTHLVKGIARARGVDEAAVSSPTFTIVQEYAGEVPIYHIDAYRVDDPDELYELGYEEYFYGDGLCLIEWPARIEALLPDDAIRLRLIHQGGDRRRIEWMNRAGKRDVDTSKPRAP